jgi:hypothetical protein
MFPSSLQVCSNDRPKSEGAKEVNIRAVDVNGDSNLSWLCVGLPVLPWACSEVVRPARPPRPSLSLVRSPPVSRPTVSGGGRLGVGCAVFGPRGACCGSSRRCDMPPVPRCASALPPRGGLLVAGFAECEDKPPAPAALPPGVGRSRGFLDVGVLHQGASRSAMSFMRAPNANLDPQILAKKPTKLGGQRRALARKRGACPHVLQNVQEATPRATNRPINAKSAPLLRRSRNTGGPRTSDSEGRGGRAGGARKKI